MRDITDIINSAILSNVDWSINLFFTAIDKIKELKIEVSFWEGEENWASIIINNRTSGYVWRRYPVILIERKNYALIKDSLIGCDYISFIEVESITKKEFNLDIDRLKISLDFITSKDYLSAEDIWFHTNVI